MRVHECLHVCACARIISLNVLLSGEKREGAG